MKQRKKRKDQTHFDLSAYKALQNITLFASIVYAVLALSVQARLFVLLPER